jgi:2,3-bisphosphoglycerate-dependent phosphoglycerate mutase
MTRLLLVRHGESMAQAEGFIGGHVSCSGLSPRGRRQVEALRDRLLDGVPLDVDALYTSEMRRAIETAAILSPAVGGFEAVQECDFCEIHPGEVDGATWDDFNERFRGPDWKWDAHAPVSPGGESWATFVERVGGALDRVVEEHSGRTILIACHGGIVRASLLHFLGLPLDSGEISEVTNSSITEWRFPDDVLYDGTRRWVLHRFNDHAHLEGTELLTG